MIVVCPGVKVEWKEPDAYVAPCGIVMVDCTVPMLVLDDEMLIAVSCGALAGRELESSS